MVKTHGVLALIPARGGSKSIPRKNVRPLGGWPLLDYSVAAGLEARLVDRVVVSTDDEEIARLGRRAGAEVPFLRPAALAGDLTPDLPVFEHALDWFRDEEGWTPDLVVQLRPTSPLRPPDCVDRAIELLRDDEAADSVRSVVLASQNPFKMWRVEPDGVLFPLIPSSEPEPYNQPRQALPASYWQTGHVDAVRASTIRERRSMTGARIRALVLDGAYACDIDTDSDWVRAEWTLTHFTGPRVTPRGRDGRLPARVRLVVFDFDGVMTDNRVWVSGTGEEWVACHRGDGMGLSALRELGVEMLVLSTEVHPVVAARCAKLRLPCEQGLADKGERLRTLLAERGIDAAEVVYVGNDRNDVDCLRQAGCGVVVADAHPEARAVADLVLSRPGGYGAVREICDLVRAHVGLAQLESEETR